MCQNAVATRTACALALHPDGTLYSTSRDKTIKVWNANRLLRTLTGHASWVRALALAPNGSVRLRATGPSRYGNRGALNGTRRVSVEP